MKYYLIRYTGASLGVRSEVQLKWDQSMGFSITLIGEYPCQTKAVEAYKRLNGNSSMDGISIA